MKPLWRLVRGGGWTGSGRLVYEVPFSAHPLRDDLVGVRLVDETPEAAHSMVRTQRGSTFYFGHNEMPCADERARLDSSVVTSIRLVEEGEDETG